MKLALVTGSAGFLGRHFADFLLDQGWSVDEVDIALPEPMGVDAVSYYNTCPIKYDLVVHGAYHVGGRASIDGLNLNLAQNLTLDAAAFNFAVRTGSPLLYFSSSAAYPIRLQTGEIPHKLRESDIQLEIDAWVAHHARSPEPDAHYGWAKLTGERLAIQARKMGATVYVVRPFSGYGEDQSFDYPFPSIVERALAGDLKVWGPPEQARDWIHVDDVIMGCWRIINSGDQTPVNLCRGKASTMFDLLRVAYEEAHGERINLDQVEFMLDKPTGVTYRVGNPEKFFKYYRPIVTLRQGVRRMLANL